MDYKTFSTTHRLFKLTITSPHLPSPCERVGEFFTQFVVSNIFIWLNLSIILVLILLVEILYFLAIHFATTLQLCVICDYSSNYSQHLQYLWLSYNHDVIIQSFIIPCGWVLRFFSSKNNLVIIINHVMNQYLVANKFF